MNNAPPALSHPDEMHCCLLMNRLSSWCPACLGSIGYDPDVDLEAIYDAALDRLATIAAARKPRGLMMTAVALFPAELVSPEDAAWLAEHPGLPPIEPASDQAGPPDADIEEMYRHCRWQDRLEHMHPSITDEDVIIATGSAG